MLIPILLIIIILILCPTIIVPFLLTTGIITASIYEFLVVMFWAAVISSPFLIYYIWNKLDASMRKNKKELDKAKKSNIIPKTAIDEFRRVIDEEELDLEILFKKATENNNMPKYLEDITFVDFEKMRDYLLELNVLLPFTTKEELEKVGLIQIKKTLIQLKGK